MREPIEGLIVWTSCTRCGCTRAAVFTAAQRRAADAADAVPVKSVSCRCLQGVGGFKIVAPPVLRAFQQTAPASG